MLNEIKKDFEWGKKTSERGFFNLDDEQVEWLIKESEKVPLLESSLKIYKEESDKREVSAHIDEFLYEFNINEKGEIPCLIKVNGIEHTFGITERDARGFLHLFQMSKMK